MIRRGDVLIYTFRDWPKGKGSLAVAITDDYHDPCARDSMRSVKVHWVSYSDDSFGESFNIDCFEKIGHIELS